MQSKTVSAAAGWHWIKDGWGLFTKDYGTWFLMFLVFIIIAIALNFVPLIGSLAMAIIMPVFMGSYMHSAREVDNGNSISVGSLFQGFRDKDSRNRLLILGTMYVIAEVVLVVAAFSMIGGTAMMNMDEAGHIDPQTITLGAVATIGLLLVMLAGIVIAMGFLFAPALVMLQGAAPIDSIKASFSACLKNILPMLVFGLIFIVLSMLAMIPMGLGFLILLPVTFLSVYCAYNSIFR